MSSNVVCCYSDDNLSDVQRVMMARNVRRLPVLLRASNELVGVLSVDDIARVEGSQRAGEILHWTAEPAAFKESITG